MEIVVIILFLLVSIWLINKIGKWEYDVGLSDKVIGSFKDIYKDKELIKDLAKILEQEGDLDKLFDKIRSHIANPRKPSWEDDYSSWTGIDMMKGYIFQPDVKIIVNKLIKTSYYKSFSKKHEFDKKDDAGMEKIFYFIMTQKDFRDVAKNFIMKATDKNDGLIGKQKIPTALKFRDLLPGYSA
jgi:hypothetical protein